MYDFIEMMHISSVNQSKYLNLKMMEIFFMDKYIH